MSSLPASVCAPSRRLQSLLAVQDQTSSRAPASGPVITNAVDSAWAELMGTATSSDDDAPTISPTSSITVRRATLGLRSCGSPRISPDLPGSRRISPDLGLPVGGPLMRRGGGMTRSMSLSVLPQVGGGDEAGGGGGDGSQQKEQQQGGCRAVKMSIATGFIPAKQAATPSCGSDLPEHHQQCIPPPLRQSQANIVAAIPAAFGGSLAWHEVEALPIIDPITKQTVSQQGIWGFARGIGTELTRLYAGQAGWVKLQ